MAKEEEERKLGEKLHTAVRYGWKSHLYALFNDPTSRNGLLLKNGQGQTPLLNALDRKEEDCIRALQWMEMEEKGKGSSWHVAVKNGSVDQLKSLFNHPKTREGVLSINEQGQTPLLLALSVKAESCVALLQEYEEIEEVLSSSWHVAVKNDSEDHLKSLCSNTKTKTGILKENEEFQSPFQLAKALKRSKCCLLYTSPSPRDS